MTSDGPKGFLPKGMKPEKEKPTGEEAIVERLKREGLLVRNEGVNSIKSVNQRLDKFGPVLDVLNVQAIEQTNLLLELVDLQKYANNSSDEERKLAALRAQSQTGPNPTGGGAPQPVVLPNGQTTTPVSPAQESGINPNIASMLSGAAGGLAAAFSAYGLRKMGKAGLIAFMAPILGTWVSDVAETISKDAGFTDAISKSIGDAAGLGTMGAMFGSMFGKRIALIFGAAGVGIGMSDAILDKLGIDKDTVLANIGGHEIDTGAISQALLGTISIAATTFLTSPDLYKSIGKFITSDTSLNAARTGLKMGIAGGVISLYLAYGDEVKNWLQSQGMPEGFANLAVDGLSFAATGASLGSIFGPQGAIIGAAIGLAIGIGNTIVDSLRATDKKLREEAYAALDGLEEKIKKGETLSEEDTMAARKAIGEADRVGQLVTSPEEQKRAEEQRRRAESILGGDIQLDSTGKMDLDSTINYLKGVMAENESVRTAFENINKGDMQTGVDEFLRSIFEKSGFVNADSDTLSHALNQLSSGPGSPAYWTNPEDMNIQGLVKPNIPIDISPKIPDVVPSLSSERTSGLISELSKKNSSAPLIIAPTTNNFNNTVVGGSRNNSTSIQATGSQYDLDNYRLGFAN